MFKHIQKIIISLILTAISFTYAFAESTLPEVMVGNPKIYYTDPINTNYYGGFSGSEVVYNHGNDAAGEFTGITGLRFCITVEQDPVTSPACSAVATTESNVWSEWQEVGDRHGDNNGGILNASMGFQSYSNQGDAPITKIEINIGAGDSGNVESTFRWAGTTIAGNYGTIKTITANSDQTTDSAKGTEADENLTNISHLNLRFRVYSDPAATPINSLKLTTYAEGSNIQAMPGFYSADGSWHMAPVNNGDGVGGGGITDLRWLKLRLQAQGGGYYEAAGNQNDTGQTVNATTSPSVQFGYAADGTTPVTDSRIAVNNTETLVAYGMPGPGAYTANFSVDFWAKWTNTGTSQVLYSENTATGMVFYVAVDGNGIPYARSYAGGWDELKANHVGTIDFNKWHHIAITRDNFFGRIYIDGHITFGAGTTEDICNSNNPNLTLCDVSSAFMTSDNYGTLHSYLGNILSSGAWANGYKGRLDEFRLYRRYLSRTEILNHYNGIYASTDNSDRLNLVGYWDFSEGVGSTTTDKSGKTTAAGTLTNVNWIKDDGPNISGQTVQNYGYDLFGFHKSTVSKCVYGIITGQTPNPCFISNSSTTSIKVMNSRTYINDGDATTEVATLLYAAKPTLVGDAYLKDKDPSNFAYWGKNLTQNEGSGAGHLVSPDSYWGFNAYRNAADSDLAGYIAKANKLYNEATNIPDIGNPYSPPSPNFNLQTSNMYPLTSGNTQVALYPNGKIWRAYDKGGYGVARSYQGIGTLVYKYSGATNDFCLGGGTSCTVGTTWKKDPSSSTKTDQLGIIVIGDVLIGDNSVIEAAIFCTETMTIGENVTLKGSFVAKDFQFPRGTNGIKIIYDRNLDTHMPPGFGELNMPHMAEN